MFRVLSWAPPLAWNFVKPCSGARRATSTTNNTLRVPDRAPPVGLELRQAGFRGSPCYLGNKQHAARAGSGAPVGLELRKTVFRGSPCYMGNKQHAQCFACGLGRPRCIVSLQDRVQGLAVLLEHNNTLNVSRAGSDAPVALYLRKAVFRGSPCYLDTNNTLNVSRAGSGAPVGVGNRKKVCCNRNR
jgi:hypothetical protein